MCAPPWRLFFIQHFLSQSGVECVLGNDCDGRFASHPAGGVLLSMQIVLAMNQYGQKLTRFQWPELMIHIPT